MNLLDYFTSEFINFDIYQKTVSIDGDGYQTVTFTKKGSGVGDLQPVKLDSTATEYGKKILGTNILFTETEVSIDDEIHVGNDVYKVIGIVDYGEYLEVHLEFRG